jgi:ABC-2 type transport system ATP-binding protein
MEPPIEVTDLVRVFGRGPDQVRALDGVSFTVPHGEVAALLGANGAGKTTLTKILSTLLLPSAGTARVFGLDVRREERRIRAQVSAIFGGDRGLYGQLSAVDNLRYFAVLGGIGRRGLRQRLADALDQVGLSGAAHRPVQTFSKGMRQRLHIAIGMISEPKLLLLDEPTVGLDPVEAQRLREAIGQLRDRGVTVLLTSHYLLDVERLADRVLVLAGGRIGYDLPLSDFIREAGHTASVVIAGTGPKPPVDRFAVAGLAVVGGTGDEHGWEIRVGVRDWQPETFGAVSQALAGATVHQVRVEEVRLEEAFAVISGRVR